METHVTIHGFGVETRRQLAELANVNRFQKCSYSKNQT